MPARPLDRLRPAERDFLHARKDLEDGFYEWACFSAQQAAEKALKGLYQSLNRLAWGHSVTALLEGLKDAFAAEDFLEASKMLDKYYIPARYPNGFDYKNRRDIRNGTGKKSKVQAGTAPVLPVSKMV